MSGFYGDNRDVDKIYTQALENAKHSSSLDYLPAVLAQVTRLKHGKKKEERREAISNTHSRSAVERSHAQIYKSRK